MLPSRQAGHAIRWSSCHLSFVSWSASFLPTFHCPKVRDFDLVVPKSEFFGGNVSIGDLWVLEDIARAVRPYLVSEDRPDLLVLPSSFLSHWGRDLLGVTYQELEARLGIEVALVKCQRIML